jgi:F-type H+-transporting ATPase subunit delta
MSSAESLARPYARAAFDQARQSNALAEWSSKLEFAAAVARDPQVQTLIGNPAFGGDKLVSLFLPQGEKADSAFANFIATLAANRRMPILADVADGFAALKRADEGVLKVNVRAAVALEANQADALKAALAKRFGRQIELTSSIDESVIGGAIIDAGDTVIDGSVRGRLERLAQTLAH